MFLSMVLFRACFFGRTHYIKQRSLESLVLFKSKKVSWGSLGGRICNLGVSGGQVLGASAGLLKAVRQEDGKGIRTSSKNRPSSETWKVMNCWSLAVSLKRRRK